MKVTRDLVMAREYYNIKNADTMVRTLREALQADHWYGRNYAAQAVGRIGSIVVVASCEARVLGLDW
jgi:hypothetical protein